MISSVSAGVECLMPGAGARPAVFVLELYQGSDNDGTTSLIRHSFPKIL